MNQIKPPFPLKPCSALICLLMLAAPLAMADTETTSASSADKAEASKKTDSKVTTQAKADAAANKIALDKVKAAEKAAKDSGIPTKVVKPKEKPAEPIRNSRGETTEELNARLKRHQENFNMTNWVETVNRKSKNNGKR